MKERSSSPFLEQPSRIDGTSSNSREKIARLEYELASMKTEKRLLEQSKESSVARYESLLSRKNEELAHLQSNFDFVYSQRQELQSKVKNQQDVSGKSSQESEQQIKSLKSENKTLTAQLHKSERELVKVTGKVEHLRSDLNRELATNDQYRERIQILKTENKELALLNSNLQQASNQPKSHVELNVARENEDLKLRLQSLQKTNNELQFKFDSILQSKTSLELLKSKNNSLAQKLKSFDAVKLRASELEVANVELQAKFDKFFGMISATVESHGASSKEEVVINFARSFKSLQNRNLVIADKLNHSQTELCELQKTCQNLRQRIDLELIPRTEEFSKKISMQNNVITELEKAKILNGKEIEFLRKSLKDIDNLTSRQNPPKSSPDNTEKVAMNQYLTNLEKLVDDYKQEIEQLRKDNSEQNPSYNMPTKRPRLIDEDDINMKSAHKLRKENIDLLSELKNLQDECESWKGKVESQEKKTQRSSEQILELRSNPFFADQLIKQETLDLLRKENTALIEKYVNAQDVESIPKSLFARQENDKDVLQNKIDRLAKQISRLKSVYAEKSRDIVAIISRFFGYNIEFLPSPMNPQDLCAKIKLVSRYTSQKDAESSVPYLIIDVQTKTLKAHGDFEFKSTCETLVEQWVSEKRSIPCFLSALNLRLHEDLGEDRV